ncbi:hypothetical protein BOX15_Mlig002948g2 [Macrostomum lignano]|uniref:CUB domain-containing protein n=1 Tax=Macrostomum lignano TaxID=282301 RepID=A0A267DEM1_9PLAT|nr:hypothetical protein BOX15_Mlig002948g2 [Macrostomum lignano]
MLPVCNSSQQVAVSPFDPPRSLVSHPGFESGRYYSINMTCSWILTVPESFFIEVWFEFLELETQLDKVQLLDANSVLMAELSDYYPNCSVLPVFSTSRNSSGTRMCIIFSTDGSVLMRGFRIRYRAVSSDRNTFRRLFAPQPAASAVGVLSARSDIECAVLCTAVGAACRAIEFDAVRGSCRLLDGPTAGGLARPGA